jgi:Sec-independent protein translocase protein TatA
MENEFGDSAYNEDLELEDLMEKFDEEEIDDDILKEIKVIPQKLREALKECYKILNEYKEDIKDLSPELFSVIGTLGKLASSSGKKYPYPEKYPYPKKVKKSMDWQGVQDMLFGGHIPADDEEIEKSSKENPFPSITRALKIKKEAIDEVEDEMEQDSFDPYDRMA